MSTTAHQRMPSSKRAKALRLEAQRRRSRRLFVAGTVGLVALFVVAIIVSRPQGDPGSSIAQTRSVTISGEALPEPADVDDAIGTQIPYVKGETFDSSAAAIEKNDVPKMIVFLAHWCPHCQAEVPVVQSWIAAEGMPDGIEVVSVATATDPNQPNYPPSEWLERERWNVPVIVDDASSSVGRAFGVNSYPFFVFVDGDGKVYRRASGELPIEHIEALLGEL